jgi:hypothetical protein
MGPRLLWPGGWPEPVRRAYLEDPPIFDPQPSEAARDQGLAAVLALALVQPLGRSLPRPLLLAAGWLAASIMILWGGALWIQHGLMEADVVGMAESMDATSTRWQLVLWNPSAGRRSTLPGRNAILSRRRVE